MRAGFIHSPYHRLRDYLDGRRFSYDHIGGGEAAHPTATSGTAPDALPSVTRIAEPEMTDSATEIHEHDPATQTTTREGPHNDLPSADVHP